MHFDPERAANVLANDPHLGLAESEVKRRNVLHHVRSLRALVDGKPCFGGVPISNDCTRLQRYAGMPAKDKVGFNNRVGGSKSLIDVPRVMNALKGKSVAQRTMNDRRPGLERGAHVRGGFQLFVLD